MKRKYIALTLLITLLVAVSGFSAGTKEEAVKEVYFLNFKPEIASVYETKVAPAFEAETGIKLKVVTAASGTYAATLKASWPRAARRQSPDQRSGRIGRKPQLCFRLEEHPVLQDSQ